MNSETDVQDATKGPFEGKNGSGFGYFNRVTDSVLLDRIRARIRAHGYFTDRVTSGRVEVRQSDIVLVVSSESELVLISHVRPARTSSTGTRGFKASRPLEVSLTQEQLKQVTPTEYHEALGSGFAEPGYRPSRDAWNAIWAGVKRLLPEHAETLRLIEQLRFDVAFDPQEGSADEQLFYEKDAVGVALDITGIPFSGVFADLSRGHSLGWPLLRSLCGSTTEDVVIGHDVRNFPAYLVAGHTAEACQFSQGTNQLVVYNVNRRPAERALGVDLIYHNVTYGAFTFVQYKMLNSEGKDGHGPWRYRPNKQFDEEMARMRQSRAALAAGRATVPDHYRISQDPFFLKLCRRQHLKVNAGELAHGIYLDITFTDLVLGQQSTRVLEPGAQVARWLNRTQFTDLVARGWLGTRDVGDEQLKTYVDDAMDAGKSLLLAVGSTQPQRAFAKVRDPEDYDWDD